MSPEEAARRLEQRRADLALVERLEAAGFVGAEYEAFAQDLARHGHRVMTAWCASRRIFGECAKRKIYLSPAPLDWAEDDRADLVQDTVFTGLRRFHNTALCQRKWTVEGGTSLKTYFIGSCVYCFADAYRAWQDREMALRLERNALALQLGMAPLTPFRPVEQQALSPLIVGDMLREVWARDEELAAILALRTDEYSLEEIAQILPGAISPRAVEGKLYRYRQREEVRALTRRPRP